MQYLSFGADAGHLMERLLEHAGVDEVEAGVLLIHPEADHAALELLREAAGGGWTVELMDAEDSPGAGDTIALRSVEYGQICGDILDEETSAPTGGYLRLDLRNVEKVHIW